MYFTEILGVFIFSFILQYSLNTLFFETYSSSLIYESTKALEIKISMLFNLFFPKNTVLSCFFFFFFIIDLYFLIPAANAQVLISKQMHLKS